MAHLNSVAMKMFHGQVFAFCILQVIEVKDVVAFCL